MENGADKKKLLRERKRREKARRRRFRLTMLGLSVFIALLLISMIVVDLAIKNEHKRALEQYNHDNWTTVETFNGGVSVYGCYKGEDFSYVDDGRFYDGVYIDGVSIGGMNFDEARSALVRAVERKLNGISMVVTVDNASLALAAQDFNVTVNAAEVLKEAYQLGRENIGNEPVDHAANYKKQQAMKDEHVELTLDYTCDREAIGELVDKIADFVNTEPVEPYITVTQRPAANTDAVSTDNDPVITDTDTVVETVRASNGTKIAYIYYHPGRNGFVLNKEVMVDRIVSAFEAEDYDCVLSAELEETAPKKTVSDIQGTVKRITSYSTDYDHEEEDMNRCRNIQKAAGILNGCVVKPGKEVSFNKYVGPRREEDGWLRAHGIVNGKEYEDSPGGGICQVSGTLYNALLQCGPNKIEITYRQHHSWPSSYLPYGLDATVDTNGPDLRWKNVSSSELYIFAYADVKKGKMYIYVYGIPEEDGSYYETYAETVEEIEPDEPIYTQNPLWPTGHQKTTIKGRNGYVAKAYLNHYDKAGHLIESIYLYTDNYKPVRQEITIGTGDPSLPWPPIG